MSWLFSDSETSLLLELNRSVRYKTLHFARQNLGKEFKSYSPWMCNVANINKLSHLFENSNFIIQDKKALSDIAKHYVLEREGVDNVYPGPLGPECYGLYLKALEHVSSVPTLRVIFNALVNHIIPLNPEVGTIQKLGAGSSTLLGRGAVFLSIPNMGELNCIQLAINMAHELGHQCLMVYQAANRIIQDDFSAPVYSYVRKENRPIIQSFHASFALVFMTEFLQKVDRSNLKEREKAFVKNELQKLNLDFKESLKEFEQDKFTSFGIILLEELRSYAKAS